MAGRAEADALEIAIEWIRIKGGTARARDYNKGVLAEVDAKEIPEYLTLNVELDVNLPQDRLQAANVGKILMDSGLVTREWIQDEILHISQPAKMTRKVWKERAIDARFAEELAAGSPADGRCKTRCRCRS